MFRFELCKCFCICLLVSFKLYNFVVVCSVEFINVCIETIYFCLMRCFKCRKCFLVSLFVGFDLSHLCGIICLEFGNFRLILGIESLEACNFGFETRNFCL